VALMEFAVIYALVIARVAMARQAQTATAGRQRVDVGTLVPGVLRGRDILLLSGGMVMGATANDTPWGQIAPFYEQLFRGMLMLFLLERGLTAARQMRAFRQVGVFMAGFGMLMPLAVGFVAVALAPWAGAGVGGSFVFGAICASASFIDAPAACRASLPEANPGIDLTA
jgi:hypothetical protein